MCKSAILGALVILGVSLWHVQLRYAWPAHIEIDRFAGITYAQVIEQFGPPPPWEIPARPRGYEIEPRARFDRLVIYKSAWGKLQLYFAGNICLDSVFYADRVRF